MLHKQKNIFLIGYYGKGNFGDQLMLYGLLKNLQDYNLTVLAYNEIPFRYINVDYQTVFNTGKKITDRVLLLIKLIRVMTTVDAVIWGGGTCFYDNVYGGWRLLFGVLKMYVLARLFMKKVGFVGIGVGDICFLHNYQITKYLIKKSDVITLRDITSYELAKKYNSKAQLVEDLAFLSVLNTPMSVTVNEKMEKIVFCGMSCYDILQCDNNDIIREISSSLDALIARNYKIEMVPMHLGNEADDTSFHNKIIKGMKYGKLVKQRDIGSNQIDDTMNAIRSATIVVSMRLHGLLAARLADKPFVALGESQKIKTFMKDNNMDEMLLKYNEIERLVDKIQTIERVQGVFSPVSLELKYEMALKNIEIIKDVLGENSGFGED